MNGIPNARKSILPLLLLCGTLLGGCATQIPRPAKGAEPSRIKFENFHAYELERVTLNPQKAENKNNLLAQNKIERNLIENMRRLLPEIVVVDDHHDGQPREKYDPNHRVLRIQPHIENIKYIRTHQRVFAHMFAGSSAIVMKVTFRDRSTGATITEPWFYNRSQAMQAGFVPGLGDNLMLNRAVWNITDYIEANFEEEPPTAKKK